jgi:hypothetical protein
MILKSRQVSFPFSLSRPNSIAQHQLLHFEGEKEGKHGKMPLVSISKVDGEKKTVKKGTKCQNGIFFLRH